MELIGENFFGLIMLICGIYKVLVILVNMVFRININSL